MSGPKYLLYSGALLVAIWGIKGVTSVQPDKIAGFTPVMDLQDNGPPGSGSHKTAIAAIAVDDSTPHGR